ncbi:MAG: type IV pilus assembly protein PilM [Gaiellaceae bacterium]
MVDWKKDIKLGELVGRRTESEQRNAVATPEPPAPSSQAAEPDKIPIWKREIKLRKPADKTPAPRSVRPVPTPAIAEEESPARPSRFGRPSSGAAASEPETKQSRFSRGGKQESKAKAVAEKPEQSEDGARRRSPLSREISFSFPRRRKAATQGGAVAPQRKARSGRKTPIVGLKIGASHIAAAHVVSNGRPEVVQLARERLERGIVVGGELRDPQALAAALKDFFRRNKLPARAVRLGVGTNRIGVRRFEISGLQDGAHLENAIRFRAQEALPIPLEEAVLDYQVVGESVNEAGEITYEVLLVIAHRDLVERYAHACREAGIKLVGIDLDAFGLLRSLAPHDPTGRDDAAVVIVSIGHDRSTFVVADGGTCEFARVLDWGGGALDVAVARALELSPSQAEPIKQSLTLNATQERLEGHTNEQAVAVYESVRRELQTFVRELVSSLHFYQNQAGSLGIGEITITGGTARLPGLAAELQRLIGVSVRVGDPLAHVSAGKRVDPHADLGSLAVAIGLGIEG